MDKPTVLVNNRIHEIGIDLLKESSNLLFLDYKLADPDEFNAAMRAADGMVVRGPLNLDRDVLLQCPKLKVIAKHGAGLDGVDIAAATDLGIIVANSGDANSWAVAEGTVALILGTLRRLPAMRDVVLSKSFHSERTKLEFMDLGEKTVGLVGFGNIGRHVAQICIGGFRTSVLAFDPAVDAAEMRELGVTKVESLDKLLGKVDVLSLHVPLTPKTRHLIGQREMALMRASAIIVNTARGGIVDEAALHEAIVNGRLAGAGLDVFDKEPPEPDNPLFHMPNVVVTPHCAGGSDSARIRSATESVAGVLDVLLHAKLPRFLINPDVVPRARATLQR